MIYYKTSEEIELIRRSCLLVSRTHGEVASHIKEGVTTLKLDQIAEEFILDHGGVPGFKGYNDFPNTLCMSINEQFVHGIPSENTLKEGDVLSIDCGAILNEFYGDSAYTYSIGTVSDNINRLMQVTKESLYLGINEAIIGKRLGDIGYAIQDHCETKNGFGVVRDLVGHGVGKSLHEDPQVPNFGKRGKGIKLNEGLVIAIEPMVNLGTKNVMGLDDGWTIVSRDRSTSVHFEHTIAITRSGPDILSTFEFIEKAVKNNAEIEEITLKM